MGTEPPIPLSLKPCPFCGNPANFDNHVHKLEPRKKSVVCVHCGMHSPWHDTAEMAAGHWNARAHPPTDTCFYCGWAKGHAVDCVRPNTTQHPTPDPVSKDCAEAFNSWWTKQEEEFVHPDYASDIWQAAWTAAHRTPDRDRALSLLRSVCTPLDHNLEIQPGCATHRCIQAFLSGEQAVESSVEDVPEVGFGNMAGTGSISGVSREISDNAYGAIFSAMRNKLGECNEYVLDTATCAAYEAIRPYLRTKIIVPKDMSKVPPHIVIRGSHD